MTTKPLHKIPFSRKNHFQNEIQYEWGNPLANLPQLDENERVLAKWAFHWRSQRYNNSSTFKGVYNGMRVVLITKDPNLENLIKAGGGEIVEIHNSIQKLFIAEYIQLFAIGYFGIN